jgi:hypothetical protein
MIGTLSIMTAITGCSHNNVDEKISKEDIKINNPVITQFPSIDGCDIKKVEMYSRPTDGSNHLNYDKIFLAKCGETETTTLQRQGKGQTEVPTIVDKRNKMKK